MLKRIIKKYKTNIKTAGFVVCTLENIYTGEKKIYRYSFFRKSRLYKNLMPTVGRNVIATRLAGSGSDGDLTISFGAVGTNISAPVSGNTVLGTELDRSAVSLISASGNTVNVRVFFGAGDAIGTLKEYGLFGGNSASSSVDTGTLFQHVAINITKSSSETLTIESNININEG